MTSNIRERSKASEDSPNNDGEISELEHQEEIPESLGTPCSLNHLTPLWTRGGEGKVRGVCLWPWAGNGVTGSAILKMGL